MQLLQLLAAREVRPPASAISPEDDKGKEIASAVKSPALLWGIVIEGSAITHLEKSDRLSTDNLKRARGAQDKLPE